MALGKFDKYITLTTSGATVPGASVQVNIASTGAPASLFSDREGVTSITNPVPADPNGRVVFYVAPDRFNMIATGGGVSVNYTDIIVVPGDEIATQEQVSGIQDDITNTNSSVAALGSQVGSLNSSVTVLENTSATTTVTNALDTRLTDVEDDLTSTNSSVGVLGSQVGSLNSSVTVLENTTVSTSNFNDLEQRVTDLENAIALL